MEVPIDLAQDITCPTCGRLNELHTHTGESRKPPVPGDVSLCIDCNQPAFYVQDGDRLALRLPTDAEYVQLLADPRVRRLMGAVDSAKLSHPADDE